MGIDTYNYMSNTYNYVYLYIQLYECLNDVVQ